MRKHDVRKWIHAVLDMLPLLIIPIFAIYMRNENSVRDISVDYQVNKVVDFNQQIKNGDFVSTDNWTTYGASLTTSNNIGTFTSFNQWGLIQSDSFSYIENHSILVTCTISETTATNQVFLGLRDTDSSTTFDLTAFDSTTSKQTLSFLSSRNITCNLAVRISDGRSSDWDSIYVQNVQVFDLTQMFGVGNEPSIQQFNDWYSNDYYSYTLGKKDLITNYSTETYSNTDVGSQMMYSLYTPVKEYFNLNNVANFGSIFDWLQLNFFNGTAPMSVFIVWNIILYEFIMDVLFLIYAVFMFIIDFVECLIDKAFGKSYRGGR